MKTDLYDQIYESEIVIAFRLTFSLCHEGTLPLLKFLKEKKIYTRCLISEEGKNAKPHLHGLVTFPKEQFNDSVTVLRANLKEWNPTLKGNAMLYVRLADNKKQLLKYTLKENAYVFYGFPADYLHTYRNASTQKENLGLKIRDNEENLLMKKIDYECFVHRHIKIKVDHGQPLYVSHIKAYVQSFRVRCGEITPAQWVEESGLLKYTNNNLG